MRYSGPRIWFVIVGLTILGVASLFVKGIGSPQGRGGDAAQETPDSDRDRPGATPIREAESEVIREPIAVEVPRGQVVFPDGFDGHDSTVSLFRFSDGVYLREFDVGIDGTFPIPTELKGQQLMWRAEAIKDDLRFAGVGWFVVGNKNEFQLSHCAGTIPRAFRVDSVDVDLLTLDLLDERYVSRARVNFDSSGFGVAWVPDLSQQLGLLRCSGDSVKTVVVAPFDKSIGAHFVSFPAGGIQLRLVEPIPIDVGKVVATLISENQGLAGLRPRRNWEKGSSARPFLGLEAGRYQVRVSFAELAQAADVYLDVEISDGVADVEIEVVQPAAVSVLAYDAVTGERCGGVLSFIPLGQEVFDDGLKIGAVHPRMSPDFFLPPGPMKLVLRSRNIGYGEKLVNFLPGERASVEIEVEHGEAMPPMEIEVSGIDSATLFRCEVRAINGHSRWLLRHFGDEIESFTIKEVGIQDSLSSKSSSEEHAGQPIRMRVPALPPGRYLVRAIGKLGQVLASQEVVHPGDSVQLAAE